MARAAVVFFLVAFFAACASAGPPAPAADAYVCAQIFSTNDTHGRLLPAVQSWSAGRLVGGSAVLAGYAAEARAAAPECPVFVVSAGDMMQGTVISNLSDGRSMIAAMNQMGYDAAAIGNHEFDWGVDVLTDRVRQAEFAMLGANIYLKGTDLHPDWVQPWTVVEKDGVRVGFVGMTTRSTPTSTRPINVIDFEFRSIADALDRYIPIVRQQNVDFVVAVMHEGAYCAGQGVCAGAAIDALEATRARFDYAVTGHTHSRIDTRVHGVPVVQSYSNTTSYGLGRLERGPSGVVRADLVEIRPAYADAVTPDSAVAALVDGFLAEHADVMGRVVMRLAAPLAAPRRGDFPLGRIIADAQRAETDADIALMNNGGIRRPLPAGDITYSDLFELQPFGNELIRVTISGAGLIEVLEHAAQNAGTDLQISGLTVRFDPAAPLGSRVREAFVENGARVEPEARYQVTVNDFIATGGSGYTMFLEADSAEPTGLVDLEALVRYLERQPRPLPVPEGSRWIRLPSR